VLQRQKGIKYRAPNLLFQKPSRMCKEKTHKEPRKDMKEARLIHTLLNNEICLLELLGAWEFFTGPSSARFNQAGKADHPPHPRDKIRRK